MFVDLHTHSTASDGQYSPAELVQLTKQARVDVMALTDHDTIEGLHDALAAGTALGMTVISGVELSAAEYSNLHILGYGISLDNQMLCDLCAQMKQNREDHLSYTADFLRAHGIPIDLEEVRDLAGMASIGRPHFARVMIHHGYVQSSREAFDRYLDTEEYNRVKRKKVPAQVCIGAIQAAGGFPVLAHPYQLHLADNALEALVKQLKAYGLAGIECYYPAHTPEQQAFYLRLAERFQLHVTAGSDFHGELIHPEDRICPVELNIGWLCPELEN